MMCTLLAKLFDVHVEILSQRAEVMSRQSLQLRLFQDGQMQHDVKVSHKLMSQSLACLFGQLGL